ncbi:N-acetyl-1-D-myo-inositol-2-amino-2-deoxy-alpha-D-glucopyranoside deacetylase [Fodinicola acaciae]|uniref:N-acetyl-1-D-myo-inositol-2-amino-2-deoxy-alpha- D-glucopyranoside deacetylase n=1 Tax=Fodinicola acaciae TaxID=2681555 RepID=UPI0013D4D13D|nr:N-acetyl-1-D-myo-inositol-2-amino-2-deoxy-alpha-D-glucopyranoside deacetylase [Fodinicola acaciae]
MSEQLPARRLLLVHAHPDDEVSGSGLAMAKYAAEGAHVTLVTCTLGEEGEVRVPALAQLAADQADQLGGYRIGELAASCAALGVTDHRFLGGAGRFRDSGMMDTPPNKNPRAFWQADVDQAAADHLVPVIREIRPQVVITYDENGFYGHPDHIQAHRVAMRGVELAAKDGGEGEPWQVSKVYWTAVPKRQMFESFRQFRDSADNPFKDVQKPEDLPFGTPDEQIAAAIDGTAYVPAKLAGMRAHASQISPDDWLFKISEMGGAATEFYTLAVGERGSDGRETDLFAGLGV